DLSVPSRTNYPPRPTVPGGRERLSIARALCRAGGRERLRHGCPRDWDMFQSGKTFQSGKQVEKGRHGRPLAVGKPPSAPINAWRHECTADRVRPVRLATSAHRRHGFPAKRKSTGTLSARTQV